MAIIRPSNRFKGRRYPNGRHESLLIEAVVLKHPDFIQWVKNKEERRGLLWLYTYIDDCVDTFDALPLVNVTCGGADNDTRCKKPCTHFTLYPASLSPYYWCDECDAYQQGASKPLTSSKSYYDALFHIWSTTTRNRTYYRIIIKHLAKAKGLKGSWTEDKIIKFYYGPTAEVAPS